MSIQSYPAIELPKRRSATADLLAFSMRLQCGHESATARDDRLSKGQVFTPAPVCRFMAAMLCDLPASIKLLDPGAGVGSLSVAVCERVLRLTAPRVLEIHAYEADPRLIPLLRRNLDNSRKALADAGHVMRFTIHAEDFVLTHASLVDESHLFGADAHRGSFDAAIINPPYYKISTESPHALAMSSIVHGQPNIYVLFMAIAAELLRPDGQLVAITPRSFCDGPYFRRFRRWFFGRVALRRIHLFDSRRDIFPDVLQESVITVSERMGAAAPTVAISTSHGRDIPRRVPIHEGPTPLVMDDAHGNASVRIPATADDTRIMEAVASWPHRLANLGLRVSTGPVVSFRATRYLLPSAESEGAAPLILVNNVKPFTTTWPLPLKGKPQGIRICEGSHRLLVPTRNYVLVRRFSAKEERRRLTASCLLRTDFESESIGLENHLNYIYHAGRQLTVHETYGLAALFNSALLDRYFRALSGSTQVNASELRLLPLPSLGAIAALGRQIKALRDRSPRALEDVVLDSLSINGEIRRALCEECA